MPLPFVFSVYARPERMIRCLIEDVTVQSTDDIKLGIRFKGGTSRIVNIPKPICNWKLWCTRPDVIKEIDHLINYCTPSEVADILNEKGVKSGQGNNFSVRIVNRIIHEYGLKTRYARLRECEFLNLPEKMVELGVSQKEVQRQRENGQLNYHKYCNRENYLYEPKCYC